MTTRKAVTSGKETIMFSAGRGKSQSGTCLLSLMLDRTALKAEVQPGGRNWDLYNVIMQTQVLQ